MNLQQVVAGGLGGLLVATVLTGQMTPVTVAPGSESGDAVEAACPTFHWGTVAGARAYELAVYRVEESAEEAGMAEPVLRERLPGSVGGWTPSLERCLEPGARYAWSIRAVGRKGASDWSIPRLFEVASRASEAELERALTVVREYLDRETPGGPETSVGATADSDSPLSETRPRAQPFVGPTPQIHAGTSGGGIVVNGALAETKADPPCYPSAGDPDQNDRFIDCGNGTVLDTVTGLLWLEWANCRSCPTITCAPEAGRRDWWTAAAVAANLRDGQCGLSDHSQPGDWRLATQEEGESILNPDCSTAPKLAGKSGGCFAEAGNAWALEVRSTSQFDVYWSSTTLVSSENNAWVWRPSDGFSSTDPKFTGNYFWPVRDGQ